MGNCADYKKDSQSKKISKYIEELQNQNLHLMYIDISSRTKVDGINREQFDILFHLNGLWSSSIYKRFDNDNKGCISFSQYSENLKLMTGGTFEQKSKVLFELYSSDQDQGVSFSMLSKMVISIIMQFYSYPKQQINRMVLQQKFLKSMDSYQLTCFFDPERKIKDYTTFQISEKDQIQSSSNQSSAMPLPEQMKKMKQQLSSPRKKQRQQTRVSSDKSIQRHNNLKSMPIQARYFFETSQKDVKKRKNSYVQENRLKTKNFKLTSNITFLVKKYVSFIFKQFQIEPKVGKLNLEQFKILLKNHERIFETYFQGFHTYVWQYNSLGVPLYKQLPVTFQSETTQKYKFQRASKYIVLIKTTLFIFNNKSEEKPIQIKSLEGLYIKDVSIDNEQFGISIFHRDGIYPQKQYFFDTKALKDEWMQQLDDFVKGNVNDDFEFIEAVGTGKFAKVYLGKQKITNQQVAIKVIQKGILTKHEQQAIKKQCSILQLCHHPNIIKFIKQYDTKNQLSIITQYTPEGDLFQYVRNKVFLQEHESAVVFKQLLETIQYLNQLGIIHRDLKPQNVLIQLNQQKTMINKIKLIDFGFAIFKKQLEIMPDAEKFAGTPGFMAPQILNNEDFDESADMFSLGIILYFMLSGYLPFYSPSYEQIVEQTKICNVTLKSSHWSNISKAAKDLVLGLLTYKQERLSFKQVAQHEWLKDVQGLKQHHGMNRRHKKKANIQN